jgi:hypothetical protein
MLHITIPSNTSSELNFSTFEAYGLPAPPNGVDEEINNDVILNFENEEEALVYAEQLEELSSELNNKSSQQYIAISDIIMTIRNDKFIQNYSR